MGIYHSGTLNEIYRQQIYSNGYIPKDKPKTKRIRVTIICSLLFGAIGFIYLSIWHAILMLFLNTLLLATTIATVYFTGEYGWLITGFYVSRAFLVVMAVYFTDKYNEKSLKIFKQLKK